jgi:hypothetical protein
MLESIKNLLGGKKGDAPNDAEAKIKKAASKGIFLEGDDARGFTEAKPEAPKAAPAKSAAPKPAAAPAPQSVVSAAPTPATAPTAPANNYQQFPGRRRPGANMKSFLDMAQQVKR